VPLFYVSLDQLLQLGGRHGLVVENPTTLLLPKIPHCIDSILCSFSIVYLRPSCPLRFEMSIIAGWCGCVGQPIQCSKPCQTDFEYGYWATCAEHSPSGFCTIGKCCLCCLTFSICDPPSELVLEDQPIEYFACVLYFGWPYLLPVIISKGTSEVNIVGQTRSVLPICREPPQDIVRLVY
jgi:hypothetical protein